MNYTNLNNKFKKVISTMLLLPMLLPSVVSIILVTVLNKYNIRYTKISQVELERDRVRDTVFGIISFLLLSCIAAIFAVIFVMPMVEQWPYRINFTLEHVADVFSDKTLMGVYKNSLLSALLTALIGTVVVYACALVSARRNTYRKFGKIPDAVSLVTNTIPGMVLGVAYLMTFKGTVLHNSFAILIICNIVHLFSSPYLLIKGTLQKLNASWETTAKLMGDSWLQTVLRIITPNAVNNMGRPYPFMVFKNLEVLGISSVQTAIKVGDTAADIREGRNAGMISVGMIEGSSVMGHTEAEYEALSPEEKAAQNQRVREFYQSCGADYVINNMSELPALITRIEADG